MIHRLRCPANSMLAHQYHNGPAHVRISLQRTSRFSCSPSQRAFSTTPQRFAEDTKTHYEVLGLESTASPAEIKKQFYALSRSSHPDIHPNDPTAAARFSSISESYHVLVDPQKRSRYDRDVIRQLQQSYPGRTGAPAGHTGSYAGSRPASGLSKRRGTFRGPPPSFYAQGGYGTTSHTGPRPDPSSSRPNTGDRSNVNEESTGPRPFTDQPLNGEFNPEPTRRTQAAEDSRRLSRRQQQLAEAQAYAAAHDFWARVLVVVGILVGAGAVGGILAGGVTKAEGMAEHGKQRNVGGFGR